MIQVWMKDHLVSDNIYNTIKSIVPKYIFQGLMNNVRFTFSVGDTTRAVYN